MFNFNCPYKQKYIVAILLYTNICIGFAKPLPLRETFDSASRPGFETTSVLVSGRRGKALQFSRDDEVAKLGLGTGFPVAEGTVDVWICPEQSVSGGGKVGVLDVLGTPPHWNRFSLALNPEKGKIIFNLVRCGYAVEDPWQADFLIEASTRTWRTNEWHRVTATWENVNSGRSDGVIRLYLDGTLAASRMGVIHVTEAGKALVLGAVSGSGLSAMRGRIDDLALHGRALSAEELARDEAVPAVSRENTPPVACAADAGCAHVNGRLAIYTAGRMRKPPEMNGRLDAGEWRDVPCSSGLLDGDTGRMVCEQAAVRIGYDATNLYLSLKAVLLGKPRVDATAHDGDFGRDDVVEWRIQPPGGRLFAVGVNADGVAYNRVQVDAGWASTRDTVCATGSAINDSGEMAGTALSFAKSVWCVEMAVPFSSFGRGMPLYGECWRLNVVVSRPNSGEQNLSWTMPPLFGQMGHLHFVNAAVVRMLEVDARRVSGGQFHVVAHAGEVAGEVRDCFIQCAVVDGAGSAPDQIRRFPVRLTTGAVKPFALDHRVAFKGQHPYVLSCGVAEIHSGRLLFQRAFAFDSQPTIRVDPVVLYTRERLRIDVDVGTLVPLPGPANCEVHVSGPSGTNRLMSACCTNLTAEGKGSCEFGIGALPPGRYRVVVTLCGATNRIAQSSREVTIEPKPVWWQNDLGKSERVPPPWEPVTVSGKAVGVWNREYTFGKGVFPEKIHAGGAALLTGPMVLKVSGASGELRTEGRGLSVNRGGETHAVVTAEQTGGGIRIAGRGVVEYDGFIRIGWSLAPAGGPVRVKRVELQVPFASEHALYMKGFSGEDFRSDSFGIYSACLYPVPGTEKRRRLDVNKKWHFSMDGWVWADCFLNEVWVGGDRYGLSLMFDSDRNWKARRFVTMESAGETALLRVTLVDEDTLIDRPLDFEMAVQATPVKPLPQDTRHWRFGYRGAATPEGSEDLSLAVQYRLMRGPGWPEITEAGWRTIRDWEKGGVKLTGDYYTNITTFEMPEFQTYGHEWEVSPRTAWSWGTRGTGVMVGFEGSYADYFLWGMNRLIDDGLKGIYLDSAGVLSSVNRYAGRGYVDDSGRVRPTIGLFETRESYKRLYNLFKARIPDAVIWAHPTPITGLASFVDATCEGEEWTDFETGDLACMTPDVFRAGYMTYGLRGVPFCLYPGLPRGFPDQVKHPDMLPICLAHNVFPVDYGYPQLKRVWSLMKEWYTSSEWFPYWRNRHLAESFSHEVKIGVYRKRGQCLLVLANLSQNEQAGTIRLHPDAMGFANEVCRISDVTPGGVPKDVRQHDNTFCVTIPRLRCAFYILEPLF